jgi:hypothetical protein
VHDTIQVLTGLGRGVPGPTVTEVVQKQRSVVVGRGGQRGHQEGLEQGKQEAADSWLPTGRMKGCTLTLPEDKIRNTIYQSRQSTAGRPDVVCV